MIEIYTNSDVCFSMFQKMSFDKKITLNMDDLGFSGDYGNYTGYDGDCCGGGLVCDQDSSMHFDSIFIPVLYSLALVVGLLGNGLVLVVLWKKRQSLNVTDIFILHLSLADTLLLMTLPFWAVEAVKGWIFGTALCKLNGALFKVGKIFVVYVVFLNNYFMK